jgi:DNA-binding CsgD family transcriptional regulator
LQLWTGRLSEARERLTALRKSMSESGDESNLDLILLWLSAVETRSANFAAAAEFAEEIAYYATVTGSQSFLAFASAQRACVRAHRGEIEETRRDCAEAAAVADRIGHTFPYVFIAAALTLLELSLGNPAAGWAACEAITVGLEEDGIRDPSMPFFLPDALQALIVLGQLDRAEALLDAFEGRGRELDRPWVLATGGRCRGLLFAARGDLAGATAALEQALREHQRLEMPFELARTLLVKGVVERRARRRAQARQALEQAFEIFERVGAPLWAERTREEIARLGLHRAGRGELTAGERRVAELAARGLTNREVAAELFVSPKTVDANLSRVYRKLGISSRAELGARMGEKRQT